MMTMNDDKDAHDGDGDGDAGGDGEGTKTYNKGIQCPRFVKVSFNGTKTYIHLVVSHLEVGLERTIMRLFAHRNRGDGSSSTAWDSNV